VISVTLDDTRLISNVVPLLKLTTSEHGIYKSSIRNSEEQSNSIQFLRRKVLFITVMLYNSWHAGTHIDCLSTYVNSSLVLDHWSTIWIMNDLQF